MKKYICIVTTYKKISSTNKQKYISFNYFKNRYLSVLSSSTVFSFVWLQFVTTQRHFLVLVNPLSFSKSNAQYFCYRNLEKGDGGLKNAYKSIYIFTFLQKL